MVRLYVAVSNRLAELFQGDQADAHRAFWRNLFHQRPAMLRRTNRRSEEEVRVGLPRGAS